MDKSHDAEDEDTLMKYFILKFHAFENLEETLQNGEWNGKVSIKRKLWEACQNANVTIIWIMSGSRYFCGYSTVDSGIDLEGLVDLPDEELLDKVRQ